MAVSAWACFQVKQVCMSQSPVSPVGVDATANHATANLICQASRLVPGRLKGHGRSSCRAITNSSALHWVGYAQAVARCVAFNGWMRFSYI